MMAPWWFESLLTFSGIIIGALMIVWQQRSANRSDLKLRLFEQLRTSVQAAASSATRAAVRLQTAPIHVETFLRMQADGMPTSPVAIRIPEVMGLNDAAVQDSVALVELLEAHAIVSEHFQLFRLALICAIKDAGDAYQRLLPHIHKCLPVDLPKQTFVPTFTAEQFKSFGAACEAYAHAMHEIGCYAQDILAESQNLLLGGIFRKRVPPRQPADPSYRVLRTDDPRNVARLRKYFEHEHPSAVEAKQYGVAAAMAGLSSAQRELESARASRKSVP